MGSREEDVTGIRQNKGYTGSREEDEEQGSCRGIKK